MKDENLIVIKKSNLKQTIGKIFAFLIRSYISINRETTLFWRKIFSSESRIRTLLESEAIVLFFNTILFAFIGNFFKGLIGEITLWISFLNILAFLIIKLNWTKKLLKSV